MNSACAKPAIAPRPFCCEELVATRDWQAVWQSLDAEGWAPLGQLLAPTQCDALKGLYDSPEIFRSRVIMARHGFGKGEYKYFSYPLPIVVEELRRTIYPHLAPIANEWNARMRLDVRFPEAHADFLTRCHTAAQQRPTPLMLKYGPGDFNCLHQDLYGEHVFPLQVALLLSQPGVDFSGGEFILSEQRPRMQTHASVAPLFQGDALVFAVHQRPVRGTKGSYRVNQRHGISKVLWGQRYTIGLIFHDAA